MIKTDLVPDLDSDMKRKKKNTIETRDLTGDEMVDNLLTEAYLSKEKRLIKYCDVKKILMETKYDREGIMTRNKTKQANAN